MVSYIHELPDWPGFRWSRDVVLERLADVRHRQGRLIGRMESLGFSSRAEAVVNTARANARSGNSAHFGPLTTLHLFQSVQHGVRERPLEWRQCK